MCGESLLMFESKMNEWMERQNTNQDVDSTIQQNYKLVTFKLICKWLNFNNYYISLCVMYWIVPKSEIWDCDKASQVKLINCSIKKTSHLMNTWHLPIMKPCIKHCILIGSQLEPKFYYKLYCNSLILAFRPNSILMNRSKTVMPSKKLVLNG